MNEMATVGDDTQLSFTERIDANSLDQIQFQKLKGLPEANTDIFGTTAKDLKSTNIVQHYIDTFFFFLTFI